MESNIVLIKNISNNEILEVKLENLVPLLVTGDYIVVDYDYNKEIDINLDNVADKDDVETIITTIEENSGGGSSGGLDRLSIINFLNNYFEEKTLINNVEAKAYQLNKENLTNLDIENTFEILNNKLLNDLVDFRNGLVDDNLNNIVLPELTYNVVLKTPIVNFTENQSTKAKIKYDFVFDRGFIGDLEINILRDGLFYESKIIKAGNTNYTLELIINDNGIDENYNISFEINDIISDVYTTSVLTNAGIIYGSKEYIENVFTEATLFKKLDFFGEEIQYNIGDLDYVFKKDPLNISHSVDVYRYRKDGLMALVQNVTNILDYGLDSNVSLKLDDRGYLKLKCVSNKNNGKYFICNEEKLEGFIAIVVSGQLASSNNILTNEKWAKPNNICLSKITWITSNTTYDISNIFINTTKKDLNVVELWDTSNITNMLYMFKDCTKFNGDLSSWDTSKVTNMSYMFYNATSFNQPLDFDTSKVTNMALMFYNAISFNKPLTFDTSSVTTMSSMFYGATSFDEILTFDTSNVIDMTSMFNSATNFNKPLDFDTSSVTTMSAMFNGATSFNQSLDFDTSNVIDMTSMFREAKGFNQPLDFNTIKVTSMSTMFTGATSFDEILTFDTSNVTIISGMFSGAISFDQPLYFDTSSVTNMSSMFNSATNFNQPLDFDTSKVIDMPYMFNGATSFNQPLDSWNTSKVTNMERMFYGATSFNQPLDYFNLFMCSNASFMFQNTTSFQQNLSTWCVPKLSSKPTQFDTGSKIIALPAWGTCPVKPI